MADINTDRMASIEIERLKVLYWSDLGDNLLVDVSRTVLEQRALWL
jgi:hypothetical protein